MLRSTFCKHSQVNESLGIVIFSSFKVTSGLKVIRPERRRSSKAKITLTRKYWKFLGKGQPSLNELYIVNLSLKLREQKTRTRIYYIL